MAKVRIMTTQGTGEKSAWFWCPGCKGYHRIPFENGPVTWDFNGDVDAPTISPSILTDGHRPERRCHSFVRSGKIQFLNDCGHELAGQTVELPEWNVENESFIN